MPYSNILDYITQGMRETNPGYVARQKVLQQQQFEQQQHQSDRDNPTAYEKLFLGQQNQDHQDLLKQQQLQNDVEAGKMVSSGKWKQVDANNNDIDPSATPDPSTPAPQPFNFATAGQAQPPASTGATPATPATPALSQSPGATPSPAFSTLFGQTPPASAPSPTAATSPGSTSDTAQSPTPPAVKPIEVNGKYYRFATPEEQTAAQTKEAHALAIAQHQQSVSDWNDHLNSLQSNPDMKQFLTDHKDDINALTFQTVTGAKLPPHKLSDTFGNMLQAAKDRADAGDLDGAKSIMDTFTKAEAATHPNTSANAPALSPAALDQAAHRFAVSGVLPPAGMGAAGQAVRTAIQNRAAELHPGADLAGNAAYYSANKGSLGKLVGQYDATDQYERTAGDNVNLYLTQIKKAIDSGSPWVNQPLREINDKLLGNTDIPALNAARQVATTEIARVTSNPGLTGNLTDTARKEVQAFNPASATPAQAYNVMKILKQDMDNRRLEGAQQLQHVASRFGAGIEDVRNIVNEDQAPTPGTTGPDGNPIPPNTPVITPKNTPTPATPPPMPPSLPFGHGAKLDPKTAKIFLDASGGDKDKARDLAKHFTWTY